METPHYDDATRNDQMLSLERSIEELIHESRNKSRLSEWLKVIKTALRQRGETEILLK